MSKSPPHWLRALGSRNLPPLIRIGGAEYAHIKTFKHDFFAVTGLYAGPEGKVILKLGRQRGFLGLPMQWIGAFLARHEAKLYRLSVALEGVPRFFGLWGPTGIVHEYVEGRPMAKGDQLDDAFFPRLSEMLDTLHERKIAYVDLEKRENILLGEDGKPYLIDFQISWYLAPTRGGQTWPARLILKVLQQSDRYHLLKHWRRARPDQLATSHVAESYMPPFWIRGHRAIFRPITVIRRQILVWLGARESRTGRSPG